ncbi:hypothetical protein ABZ920_18240 [Streptomyces sp. NPDC046831]|uniref:hypothetical protein n=1 Tax=Streptomyces sp. NPDC046831 TaxID=3154805 RepID=UPI0033CB2A9C
MRWGNIGTGARAVLDPTGKALPARAAHSDFEVRSFDEGVHALISALDAERDSPPEPAEGSRPWARRLGPRLSLSRLRIVAVTASFLSAVLTSALGLVSLASGTNWPVAVISASSVVATVGIGAFFAALQYSLRQKERELHHRDLDLMRKALMRMAENQVQSLEANSLIRRSKGDPELASALLIEILSEYDEGGRRSLLVSEAHSPHFSVEQVMKTASEDHPVVRMLRRLAADVQEAL